MKKTAIILGAGASAADKAPVQAQVLAEYVKAIADPTFKYDDCQIYREYEKVLWDFFFEYYGINIYAGAEMVEYPPFEEIMGILEVEITEHVNNQVARKRIERVKDAVITAMEIAIKYSIDHSNKDGYKENFHQKMIKNIDKTVGFENISILSLNYDTLIDDAIKVGNHQVDYHLKDEFLPNRTRGKGSQVELFKLHGSLNWLHCDDCGKVNIMKLSRVVERNMEEEYRKGNVCCLGEKKPLLIPPTYFKVYPKTLRDVWHDAFEKLKEVEKMIICGYSLPDADMAVKVIFKRMELLRDGNLPEIDVYNHFQGEPKWDRDKEIKRFKGFFKSQVNYREVSFEDFAENPSKYLKK